MVSLFQQQTVVVWSEGMVRRGEVNLVNIGVKSGLYHLLQLWACHCTSLTSTVPSLKWDYSNTPTAVQRGLKAMITDQSDRPLETSELWVSGSHSSLGFGGRCWVDWVSVPEIYTPRPHPGRSVCVCWAKGGFPWNVAECPLASCGGQEGPEEQWMCGGRGPREVALEGTWPGARILSAPPLPPSAPALGCLCLLQCWMLSNQGTLRVSPLRLVNCEAGVMLGKLCLSAKWMISGNEGGQIRVMTRNMAQVSPSSSSHPWCG